MKRPPPFDRLDDTGARTAFIAKGGCSVGVVVRICSNRHGMLNDAEWKSTIALIDTAPALKEAVKKALFLADVEAANVDQTPNERERWLNIGRTLRAPLDLLKQRSGF